MCQGKQFFKFNDKLNTMVYKDDIIAIQVQEENDLNISIMTDIDNFVLSFETIEDRNDCWNEIFTYINSHNVKMVKDNGLEMNVAVCSRKYDFAVATCNISRMHNMTSGQEMIMYINNTQHCIITSIKNRDIIEYNIDHYYAIDED